ncbi:hypothetical protein QL104_01650 [Pseudomonas piscis]|uniref:Uncharacterized protein n=1 Tax=Pseudomonas piscis TaxID=2614538 RepID=A0ABY9NIF9_9PSED|nr:hypothetical protein [Pseudomonas piscis]WMN18135.1 hypothetical protein QL104_01650 [Pseudomonas piscis]
MKELEVYMPDLSTACIVALMLATLANAHAQPSADATVQLDGDNFARAETNLYMGWAQASQIQVRDALAVLGSSPLDYNQAFGHKGRVDPIRHLLGGCDAKIVNCLVTTPG